MTPLRHPPVFSEPIYGMETTGADTAELAGWLAEVGPGLPGRIRLVDHERARGVTLGFTAGEAEGEIRAGLDRPCEEYHLWPNDAAASPHEDPPGRVGKRRNRVSLSAAAWPGLSAWTREPWLNLSAVAG